MSPRRPCTLLGPADWARGVEQELDRVAAASEATTVAMLRPRGIAPALGRDDPPPSGTGPSPRPT